MLGPARYLLGTAEILLLAGFAWMGASQVRARLLPTFQGAPAHLATSVLALALLIWVAELLGTVSLFKPLPYVLAVIAIGLSLRLAVPPVGGREAGAPRGAEDAQHPSTVGEASRTGPAAGTARPAPGPKLGPATWVALAIAAAALLNFAWDAKPQLSTGMTGFDSTWYHGPFAAGFFQTGNTIDLHFIAPQFLAWFYPANGEILHAAGMLAFGRDVLSPLLNIGWFGGCLLACWCVGRPYRVAPWSLALGAVALSVPALSDQAGEARNDIVGIFFLLAAVAIALNAWGGWRDEQPAGGGTRDGGAGVEPEADEKDGRVGAPAGRVPLVGALVVVGLAAGLAAGTKLNFLLPAVVLVVGLVVVAARGVRWRALAVTALAALAGGGYWYLRNLVHAGSPLPWVHHLGPISLPAPEQGLGGREAHSVAGYLLDGPVWSDWFLPGLHGGLWIVWPLLAAAALAGLLFPLAGVSSFFRYGQETRHPGGRAVDFGGALLLVAALVGLATAVAWLLAPTSASGPEGMPRGFESGLRYLAPALVLGLALLPAAPFLRSPLLSLSSRIRALSAHKRELGGGGGGWDWRRGPGIAGALIAVAVVLAVAVGYPVQRHYLHDRYADPSFTTPGLNAAFAWARDVSGARIATTSTRQYPLFGTDLSNHVQFVGEERPHGGFEAPTGCRAWRRLLDRGDYDYVVASRDRIESAKPAYPPAARWTEGPQAEVILRKPPTVVFELTGRLDPSACP